MKRFQTLTAVVVVCSLFLIVFYSSINLEMNRSWQTVSEVIQKRNGYTKTKDSEERNLISSPAKFYNISVSKRLLKAISHNEAYWNRLFYSSVATLEKNNNMVTEINNWSSCRESRKLVQTNVHNFASYPVLFQSFMMSMKCRLPPILINQPNKCISNGEGNHVFLLFAIKSSPKNFARREVVRETWGNETNHPRVRTVFLLGSATVDDPDLAFLLSMEEKKFGDILQWDFHESFFNLTLKMSMFLRWAVTNCPDISFIFSGDDDVFVNTPALLKYLLSRRPSKASNLYAGHVISHATPRRDPKNKYYIPLTFYDGNYPSYSGGGGFIFSGALLKPLYSIYQVIPFHPIDDVYIGMCLLALGVIPISHKGFKTFDIGVNDRENLCAHKKMILVHRRSPQEIKKLWRGIHDHLLTC